MRSERHAAIGEFTRRQREVVTHLLRGTCQKEIGLRLGVEARTVYWHVENLYRLAGVHSVGEFFAWAIKHQECCRLGRVLEHPHRRTRRRPPVAAHRIPRTFRRSVQRPHGGGATRTARQRDLGAE